MKKSVLGMLVLIVMLAVLLAGCKAKSDSEGLSEVAKPSNAGGPGEAVNLTGDPVKGAEVFQTTCTPCHAAEGKGGVANPGSKDTTIPELSPIDPSLVSSDQKTYVTNLDLFLEHGSMPEAEKEGTNPSVSMPAFGDTKTLTPQQIADVIAYVISLNQK
jgi:mono/diheme cytochrome c family protein